MEESERIRVYKILIISLIVCSSAILIVNVKNDSKNVRMIRKIQQFLYNQALTLFVLALFTIYTYKTKV
jgi:hypothetical protein